MCRRNRKQTLNWVSLDKFCGTGHWQVAEEQAIGPKETEVISRLSYDKVTLITKKQFDKLFGRSLLTRQIIYQLKKGISKPIIKGIWGRGPDLLDIRDL
jgi:hypothetical protein